jgi:excinuclease ABC subunit B
MGKAMGETARRRAKQVAYNTEHGITPLSIHKPVDMQLALILEADYMTVPMEDYALENITTEAQLHEAIQHMETQMREAAKKFEFERAAALRDRVRGLKQRDLGELFAQTPVAPALDAAKADPPQPTEPTKAAETKS